MPLYAINTLTIAGIDIYATIIAMPRLPQHQHLAQQANTPPASARPPVFNVTGIIPPPKAHHLV